LSNPYRKLPAGSPVTAFSITAWNRMIDMLNWWQTAGGGKAIQGLADWDQTVFRARNDTGGDVWSYTPVGIDGPIWSPTDGEQEFLSQTSIKAVVPDADDHKGRWGVMLEAAPDGGIGRCCLAGVVPVRVYCRSYLDQQCDVSAAEMVGTETVYVSSGSGGAKILWWEASSDTADETIVWAIVRLGSDGGGFDRITGLTTAAVTDGNTTITIDNIKVISGVDPREDTSSTSETLTGTKPSSWTADENKKAWLEWNQTDETWDAYQLDGCSVPS
jgi:hypothetical protein